MKTLGQYKSRPFTSKRDMSHIHAGRVIHQIPQFIKDHGKIKPEVAALTFYLSNHAWGHLSLLNPDTKILSDDHLILAELYHLENHMQAIRMFYYMILICTRETRHMLEDGHKAAVFNEFPPCLKEFHDNHVHDTKSLAQIKDTCENVPKVLMGDYTQWLVTAFKDCTYGPSFGGDAWADVASCLRDFVHGELSPEIFIDTAFTLCHNGGPIFNKGMLYFNYTSNTLRAILDVQASGQIPKLVTLLADTHENSAGTAYNGAYDFLELASKILGPDFSSGEVNWVLVQENAITGSDYTMHIDHQFKGKGYWNMMPGKHIPLAGRSGGVGNDAQQN